MTEQEKQRRLAEIDAELARRSGDKKALAEATNRLFQLQVPKKQTPASLSPAVTEPASARLARTGQAAADTLGAARPKVNPRNAPDTGATSLVANKVKLTPAPTRTQPTAKTQGTPTRRLTYDQAQKALTASGGGTPAKGLEAVDKAFKDVQKAKESQSPRALDKQFAAELALKRALGESTMKGRTAEQLRQGEVLRQGRGTPYVAPDTAQQDLEAAVITTLLGIAPGVGGQLAIGAAGKLIPEATQVARPMLSNLLRGGAAIGGAAGTAKAQDIALENVLGQDQYTKMQQNLAEFQGRQPLLTSMLQGGAGAIMQRPSLAASLGERLVGAGMGAGLSVGGDIMAGQPTDLSKAGIEALVNFGFAGPNTKSGDVLESVGGKAVTSAKKAIAGVDMSQVMPDSPYVPRTITKQAPPRMEDVPLSKPISFVDPNAKTTRVPVTEAPVTQPEYWTGAGMAKARMAQRERANAKAVLPTPEPTPVPAPPVKQTAETLTRPAEPVKETPKSEQVLLDEWDKRNLRIRTKYKDSPFSKESASARSESDAQFLRGWKDSVRSKSLPQYEGLNEADLTHAVVRSEGIDVADDAPELTKVKFNLVNQKDIVNTYPELIKKAEDDLALSRSKQPQTAYASRAKLAKINGLLDRIDKYRVRLSTAKSTIPELEARISKLTEVAVTPEPTVGEVTPPVVKEPLTTAKQAILADNVKSSLAGLNSPDKAVSEAARVSLDESLATLRDNAIIKGEGVKTTGKVTDKDTFAQSVKEAFGVTDEQAGELSDLVDDWAHGWAKKEKESGRLPDATAADFYATIGGIHRFDDDLAQLVLGKKAATSKGARLPESKVIIALQKGDTTTAVHEMAHHFLDTLPEAARNKVMDSLPGTTSANVHEQFATGFEAGLKDVNSPLHRYYKKFKLWIDETYKGLVNKWKSYKDYEEGGLKVTTTGMGNVVSFTTGLKGDALDVVMDYINTGRMVKGSAVEGVTAPKSNLISDNAVDKRLRSDMSGGLSKSIADAFKGGYTRHDIDGHSFIITNDGAEFARVNPDGGLTYGNGTTTKASDEIYSIQQSRRTEGVPAPNVDAVAPKSEPVQVSKEPQFQTDGNRSKIEGQKGSATTQVATTQGSYKKAAELLRDSGVTGRVLDYGAGLGLGSDAVRGVIPNSESYEPFPERWKSTTPPTYTDSSEIQGKFDGIVNLNVLNVLEPSIRDAVLTDIGNLLRVGGKAVVGTRKWQGDVNLAKNSRPGDEPKAIWIAKSGGDVYQKGFDGNELKDYAESLLGPDYSVRKINGIAASGIEITRLRDSSSEPQFQTDDSANESTVLGIPLKNAAIQGYFDVDPETLKDNSTTIEAERKKIMALANDPKFAGDVISKIESGNRVITPTLSAENAVAAAEIARRRTVWEVAKSANLPQEKIDKAYTDYMKFVQATKDIGTEVALVMRMRQEAVGSDPLDPDSYISRAASTFTRDLNDPAFKEFVDKITAKSAVARQNNDQLQAEITRLNTQVEELLKGTPAETEVKKAEAEQQVFGTATVPKRKKVAEGTTEATEGQRSTGGTTAPTASKVSGTTAKVKSAGRDRAFAKLTSDKISDSVSSLAKEALSIAKGLAAKYGDKKPQFQTDDEVDVDTQDISDFRRDMIGLGRGLLAAGTRNFKTWKEEIDGILDDAGIDPLEEHQYQVLWVDSKLSLRDEVGDVQSIKSSTAGTTIQQVIGSLGLDGAGRWLDGISDQDGNPTIFEKMVKGEALTPAELDGAARVWMQVQRASGLKVSKRGKVGALADIKRVAGELRRASAPTTDMTMDSALSSIKRMTEKLGKQTGTAETPVLRARLSRFNAMAVALAKKSIGTDKGQLSTTEFAALVDSAAQAFKDAGSDVEKHQQVLRDLRSSVLKARGLDPNARYQFSGKSDATLRAETDAKFAQNGQSLVDLVKSYASGRKQSVPNPLLDLATVEYAKAGNSIVSWAKAVENRWGSKLDRGQLDALYAQAGMKFASMNDPATGVPYAVQIRRIKEQMEYEVQKLTYDQLSPADKAIRSLGEIGMAITGNVASFDYSFAGRQAGTALILSPDLYAKALLAGVKATGIGKVSPEQQSLLFDNVSSAFFNDRFGSADYYKKAGLEITDDAFSDIYTHHGLITPNGMFVSNALSTVGVKPILSGAAWVSDKRGNTAKAEALRARGEAMVGPGQRSEAMNRMFVKQLRFDLFRRLTKDGMVYKGLTDQLEAATTDAERAVIQKKITYQDEYNKMMSKLISITTGKAAVERASVRNMLTTLGRVGVWSPSFWLSRVQAMTAYPAWDVVFGQNDLKAVDRLKLAAYPIALQQAEIQAFNLALFLLSRIPGVQIMATDDDESGKRKTPWNWLGTDPLNTDFGKVKYEGQEYDLSAGMRKHIVFAQRSYELAAQGYEDWWREQKGQLPKDNEYDPYYDSKVTVEDGKRQLLQYIKSSMNPVAGTMYDIMRGGAEDALGRKMSPLETSLRMIVPIPLANVAYSTFVDRPEEARRAAQTQDPALMQRVQDNNNTFVRDTVLTSFADMVGVSSAVRDRELEDGIKQASKHSGWMSKGYVPSKKDDELRNQVTKLIKDSIALSGTGTTYPSKKEVDMQAREILKMIPLAKMDRESLLSVKNQFAEQVAKGKKVHKYMKTTPFSINGNLPK